MSDEILNTQQRDAIGTLLTELRSEISHGYRRRQGENWLMQRALKGDSMELAEEIRCHDDVEELIKNDDLPDSLIRNEAMQDFIGFVDAEATRNWTQPYDTETADLIIEGFIEAARSAGARPAMSNR